MVFHFRLFPGKINDKIFQKMRKTPFLVNFGPTFHTFGQSRTFLILTKYNCANFQKKKNYRADSKQHWFQTEPRTDKHDFMGPFLLKPGLQKFESNK